MSQPCSKRSKSHVARGKDHVKNERWTSGGGRDLVKQGNPDVAFTQMALPAIFNELLQICDDPSVTAVEIHFETQVFPGERMPNAYTPLESTSLVETSAHSSSRTVY